jgi:hypothetical protein
VLTWRSISILSAAQWISAIPLKCSRNKQLTAAYTLAMFILRIPFYSQVARSFLPGSAMLDRQFAIVRLKAELTTA